MNASHAPQATPQSHEGATQHTHLGALIHRMSLPIDVWRCIYEYDPTYHEVYRGVMKELRVTYRLVKELMVKQNPAGIRFEDKDLERFAYFLRNRRSTPAKAFALNCCFYMTKRGRWFLPLKDKGIWIYNV